MGENPKKPNITIVDDDPGLRKTLSDILGLKGYAVHAEALGKEAVKRIEADIPDVVLIDLRLEDMDGLNLLKKIREISPLTECILITGHASRDSAIKAMNLGAYGYVQKPYDIEQLIITIRRAVEKREAAIALRDSEHKFRVVFDKSYDVILVIDSSSGDIITANPAVERVLGYRKEELTGKHFSVLFPEEEYEKGEEVQAHDGPGRARWKEILNIRKQGHRLNTEDITGRVNNGIFEARKLIRKNREFCYADLVATLISWGNEKVILANIRDITERKRAEDALAEERSSLAERVVERTRELSLANRELARSAKLKDEFLASMSHELRTPLTSILGLAEALSEKVYGELNQKQVRSLHRIEESGRHLLSLINDILDVSKIEAGKFELEYGPVSLRAVCRASLGLVRESARKKGISISFEVNLGSKDKSEKEDIVIQADELRLKQTLVNLLSNAVKFTPENGKIGLQARENHKGETVDIAVWDTGIGISEKDMQSLFTPFMQIDSNLSRQYNGTGLGLALAYRLVNMHGGNIHVDSRVGLGSRFTISLPRTPQSLLSQHNAEEDKSFNQPEKASAGLKDAPFADPDGDGLSKDNNGRIAKQSIFREKETEKKTGKILLAEDNRENQRFFGEYLEDMGFEMIYADSGKEAVFLAKSEKPDIILMDIQMPGTDGISAIRDIREDEQNNAASGLSARVPVIALTALAMIGDKEKCLEAGADIYLSKPVRMQNLVNEICKLMQSPKTDQNEG